MKYLSKPFIKTIVAALIMFTKSHMIHAQPVAVWVYDVGWPSAKRPWMRIHNPHTIIRRTAQRVWLFITVPWDRGSAYASTLQPTSITFPVRSTYNQVIGRAIPDTLCSLCVQHKNTGAKRCFLSSFSLCDTLVNRKTVDYLLCTQSKHW